MTESPLLGPLDLEEFRSGDSTLNVRAAVAAVRSYCGWHVAPVRTETVTVDVSNGIAVLPTLRATGVVVVDGATTLAADDYQLRPGHIRLRGRTSGTVTVTLTHGYDKLPDDLRRAALSMADTGTATGGRLKSAGPFTYEFSDGETDQDVLDRYRLPRLA